MKNLSLSALALLAFATALPTHAQAVKWHPGHYLRLNGGDTQAQNFRNIDEIAKEPAIKGVQFHVWWYELEPSKGVYNFSKIDAHLNKLKSLSSRKQLWIHVMDRKFGTTSKSGIVPNYLLTDRIYNGGVTLQSTQQAGYVARLWEAPVMDRLIALYRALGTRYDGDSYVEGFTTEETTLSLGSKWPAGYSTAALTKQYLRFAATARQTMPHTQIILGTNFLGSSEQMGTLLQAMIAPGIAAGGPSTVPGKVIQSQLVWTGRTGADYRGALAIAPGVEAAALGGKHGNFTPKQVADYAYSTLGVNYLIWNRNEWTGTAAQRWKTGILPFLRTNPPTRMACPSSYGLCNGK